uniref:Cnidarian restricted protein n=1 Tax=Clytia hemisphaerica TaxID=252671 RepID=A0A7M5XCH5_9CNID
MDFRSLFVLTILVLSLQLGEHGAEGKKIICTLYRWKNNKMCKDHFTKKSIEDPVYMNGPEDHQQQQIRHIRRKRRQITNAELEALDREILEYLNGNFSDE